MRNRVKGKQLGRTAVQRKALKRSLASALINEGRIKTTLAKAKTVQPFIERNITKAGKEGINTVRELRKIFSEKDAKTLIQKWSPLFKKVKGGYTRIIKLPNRPSDASPMAFIEFTNIPKEKSDKKPAKKVKKAEK